MTMTTMTTAIGTEMTRRAAKRRSPRIPNSSNLHLRRHNLPTMAPCLPRKVLGVVEGVGVVVEMVEMAMTALVVIGAETLDVVLRDRLEALTDLEVEEAAVIGGRGVMLDSTRTKTEMPDGYLPRRS